jgi:hypothetical protein
MNAESEAVRVAAIKEILDRAYGKSTITADVHLKRDVRQLSTDELIALIEAEGAAGEASEDDPGTVH